LLVENLKNKIKNKISSAKQLGILERIETTLSLFYCTNVGFVPTFIQGWYLVLGNFKRKLS
jgi:hypothetical protein